MLFVWLKINEIAIAIGIVDLFASASKLWLYYLGHDGHQSASRA